MYPYCCHRSRRAALDAASISGGCDGCCLTRLVERCGPRKTDTISIGPALLPAWKRQRFRDRCHDRPAPQSDNMRRQRENARTAYYQGGKREEHFLRQSHLLTRCLICLSALMRLSGASLGAIDTQQRFQDGCVRGPKW